MSDKELRLELSKNRIREMLGEESVPTPFRLYFQKMASFVMQIEQLRDDLAADRFEKMTEKELQAYNESLYVDVAEENYEKSYANPAYAVSLLGQEYGQILCFLYTEIRGMIVYAYEHRTEEILIFSELLIEIYNCFEEEELPTKERVQQIIYWFFSDYSEVLVDYRIREQICPELSFARDIIMKSDLSDLRYLYQFGEYITENERALVTYMNQLTEEEICAMADTFTEGYRKGFAASNKDISKKKVANIHYSIGFERMMKVAIQNFQKMGLQTTIYRAAVSSINKRNHIKRGYFSTTPNKQYDYDHRADQGLYLDKQFIERKLEVMRTTFEENKEWADVHGGPAVQEIFGELPFTPMNKPEAIELDEKQRKWMVYYDNEASQLTNQYIKGEERSFTIIAYPVPQIGNRFQEIFKETVKINTLNNELYQKIQQTIIDQLDQGEYVHIKGNERNKTDLKVAILTLENPQKETAFENCTADVNIPVGEVFTTPVLEGTNGILHVSQVYLNELNYIDLEIIFQDGMVSDYNCKNFEQEEENKKYIQGNLLFHHDTLPLGEFAIGTNTTAYVMAKKYNIESQLPILIAEKMGPHFAIGDTCYNYDEENITYNPDGKSIVARDNSISILRKEDMSKAYFNCHTDITIPYDELQSIIVVKKDGTQVEVIQDGKFVLLGTEELNKPFENK